MSKFCTIIILFCCVILSTSQEVQAQEHSFLSEAKLVHHADIIVEVTIMESKSSFHNGLIITHHVGQVHERLHGVSSDKIIITQLGGTVDDTTLSIPSIYQLSQQKKYLLLLKKTKNGMVTVNNNQGVFEIFTEQQQEYVRPVAKTTKKASQLKTQSKKDMYQTMRNLLYQ